MKSINRRRGVARAGTFVFLAATLVATEVFANDIDPFGFEKEHFISAKSRAEVVADLKRAQAAGELLVPGEIGAKVAETRSIKSRAQVLAETLEAKRLGLVTYGEAAPKQATPAQERQIELAGMRAAAGVTASR